MKDTSKKDSLMQPLTVSEMRHEYMAMKGLELFREWLAAGKPRRDQEGVA